MVSPETHLAFTDSASVVLRRDIPREDPVNPIGKGTPKNNSTRTSYSSFPEDKIRTSLFLGAISGKRRKRGRIWKTQAFI